MEIDNRVTISLLTCAINARSEVMLCRHIISKFSYAKASARVSGVLRVRPRV